MKRDVWLFLLLTFGFSWGCWRLLISTMSSLGAADASSPAMLLWPLGQFGPGFAVLLMSLLAKIGIFDVRLRRFDGRFSFQFLAPKWYLVVLLPLLGMAPSWLWAAASNSLPQLGVQPAVLIPSLLSALLFSVGEEIGWRGWLLPVFLGRFTPFTASILVGIIWGVWHIPILAFSVYESNIQFVTFLSTYVPSLVLWSILFTWVYERTNRNVWMVILLHGSFTATYNSFGSVLESFGTFGSFLPLLWTLVLVGGLVMSRRRYWFRLPCDSSN